MPVGYGIAHCDNYDLTDRVMTEAYVSSLLGDKMNVLFLL